VVDRPVENRRRHQPRRRERGHDRVGLPMTARRVIAQSDTARAAAIPTQQIGGDAAFIEKEIVACVPQSLTIAPPSAVSDDVRSSLFVGVQSFF
jgi:hypothetical protein